MNFFEIRSRAATAKMWLVMLAGPLLLASILIMYLTLSLCLALALYTDSGGDLTANGNPAEPRPGQGSELTAPDSGRPSLFRWLTVSLEKVEPSLPRAIYGSPPEIWSLRPLLLVGGGLGLFFAMVSEYSSRGVRRYGGGYVAELLEAVPLCKPKSLAEKRFLRVVEEMAVVAGLTEPQIYLLPREKIINSLVAGLRPEEAAIIVTQGVLDHLDTDELRALAAHEYARILSDDFAINHYITSYGDGLAVFSGLALLIWIYLALMAFLGFIPLIIGGLTAPMLTTLALALLFSLCVWGGKLIQIIIQPALRRNNDNLADAFAAQFTRDPKAVASVLKKVGGSRNIRPSQAILELSDQYRFMVDPVGLYLSSLHPKTQRVTWADRIRLLTDPAEAVEHLTANDKTKAAGSGKFIDFLGFGLAGFLTPGRQRQSLETRIKSLDPDWDRAFPLIDNQVSGLKRTGCGQTRRARKICVPLLASLDFYELGGVWKSLKTTCGLITLVGFIGILCAHTIELRYLWPVLIFSSGFIGYMLLEYIYPES